MTSLKQNLKSIVSKLPGMPGVFASRAERHVQRYFDERGVSALNHRYVEKHGATVTGGPFAGLKYINGASGSVLVPKLLGTYEAELQPTIEAIVDYGPDVFVDLGAAEGYYAVGIAKRSPAVRVIAFEINPQARERIQELAHANGVSEQVQVKGQGTARNLCKALASAQRPVVWCDVEGAEESLLDPEPCPALRNSFIIFETHENFAPGAARRVIERFRTTHAASLVEQDPGVRSASLYPQLGEEFSQSEIALLLSEFRSERQGWIVLRPRAL